MPQSLSPNNFSIAKLATQQITISGFSVARNTLWWETSLGTITGDGLLTAPNSLGSGTGRATKTVWTNDYGSAMSIALNGDITILNSTANRLINTTVYLIATSQEITFYANLHAFQRIRGQIGSGYLVELEDGVCYDGTNSFSSMFTYTSSDPIRVVRRSDKKADVYKNGVFQATTVNALDDNWYLQTSTKSGDMSSAEPLLRRPYYVGAISGLEEATFSFDIVSPVVPTFNLPTTSINSGQTFQPVGDTTGGDGTTKTYRWLVDDVAVTGQTSVTPTIPSSYLTAGNRKITFEVTQSGNVTHVDHYVWVGTITGASSFFTSTQTYTTNVPTPVYSILSQSGSGASINSSTGVLTKPTSGSGTITIKATNGSDSSQFATKVVTYSSPAIANFDLSATSINTGSSVSANDNSGGIGTITRVWKIDGVVASSLANQATPTFTGLSGGQFHTIRLEITDDGGTTATERTVWVGSISGLSALVNSQISTFTSDIIGTKVWSVDSGGGSINSSTGEVTAPSSGTGTMVIRATKSGDSTVFNTKSITFSVDAAKPSDVNLTKFEASGGTSILVEYDPATDNSNLGLKYVIEFSANPAFTSGVTSVETSVGVLSTTLNSGISPNTKYYGRVKAKDPAGNLSENYSNVLNTTTDNVLVLAPGTAIAIDGNVIYGFSGSNSTWSTNYGTLWLNKACTIPYVSGSVTGVYLKPNNTTGTGTISNTAMGTMTLTVTGVVPSVPHYPSEWETDKAGVVLVIARDGTPSGRVLGNGLLLRHYKLVFNNRRPAEVTAFEDFWNRHYPHKLFRYTNVWNGISGMYMFDSPVKPRAKGVQQGDFEVAIKQVR